MNLSELTLRRGRPHAGLVRQPNVRTQQRLSLLEEALRRHSEDLKPQVVMIIERARIRIRRP